MLLASPIMRQTNDNHYKDSYPVKLPFVPKAQLIFKCQTSEIHWENKCLTLFCVTENILTEKVLSF